MTMSASPLAMGSLFFHFSLNLLLVFFSVFLVTSAFATNESDRTFLTQKVVDIDQCRRIEVCGCNSRLTLWGDWTYFSSYRVTLVPVAIPERLHNKIKVCFHKNNTLELCQCKEDEWKGVEKGMWGAIMSPYETRYADIKFDDELWGSVTISLIQDFKHSLLRYHGLFFGFLLMIFARRSWPLAKGFFRKWTTRAIATTLIFQSTFDIPLAFGTVVICVAYCNLISLIEPYIERLVHYEENRK